MAIGPVLRGASSAGRAVGRAGRGAGAMMAGRVHFEAIDDAEQAREPLADTRNEHEHEGESK